MYQPTQSYKDLCVSSYETRTHIEMKTKHHQLNINKNITAKVSSRCFSTVAFVGICMQVTGLCGRGGEPGPLHRRNWLLAEENVQQQKEEIPAHDVH